MPDQPKLIIFDCDGTLVDSQHAIVAAMATAFEHFGIEPLAREKVLSIVGLSLMDAVGRLLPNHPPERVAEVAQRYKQAFFALRQSPDHTEPFYPGIRDLLDWLKDQPHVLLGIATGKSRRGVAALLERENIESVFQTIQTSDTNPSKPHPGMLHAALDDVGLEPHQALMVGDTTFDMDMAANANMQSVAVAWGYHDGALLKRTAPTHFVGEAGELRDVVERFVLSQPAVGVGEG